MRLVVLEAKVSVLYVCSLLLIADQAAAVDASNACITDVCVDPVPAFARDVCIYECSANSLVSTVQLKTIICPQVDISL